MSISRLTSVTALSMLAIAGTASADLITNGNFSAGNTGFTSTYQYVTTAVGSPSIYDESTYGIAGPGTDTVHPSWSDFVDNTTGDGNGKFMIVNGWDSLATPNIHGAAWAQTVNAGAAAGSYSLSAYFAALYSQNRAGLEFRVYDNTNTLVAFSNPSFATTQPDGSWQQQSLVFNMLANTNYSVQIWDTSGIANGNDYAIDDIRLTSVVPLPPAALAGLSSLAGVGAIAAVRRKRLARA